MKGCSKRTQEGMTLIEVLVAMLILGVGLLGAAMIQLNALKYTDSSRMTSQASFIAYDMLDRIRANGRRRLHRHATHLAQSQRRPGPGSLRLQDQYHQFRRCHGHRHHRPEPAGLHHHHFLDDARAANTSNAAEARRSFVLTSRVAVDPVATP